MNIQFKKGVLEMCVLAMLQQKDWYGYDIANTLSHRIDIADGTIYPILRRLKQESYVTSYLKESSSGPPRKYYRITPGGTALVEALRKEWDIFEKQVDHIMHQTDLEGRK